MAGFCETNHSLVWQTSKTKRVYYTQEGSHSIFKPQPSCKVMGKRPSARTTRRGPPSPKKCTTVYILKSWHFDPKTEQTNPLDSTYQRRWMSLSPRRRVRRFCGPSWSNPFGLPPNWLAKWIKKWINLQHKPFKILQKPKNWLNRWKKTWQPLQYLKCRARWCDLCHRSHQKGKFYGLAGAIGGKIQVWVFGKTSDHNFTTSHCFGMWKY